jgi:two-component system, NtrC family, sensor kinase
MNATIPQQQVILVIDDNPTNIRVIVECLKTHGFSSIVARDGAMGIQRAQFSQPVLILLDVMMPDVDGFETCRRLKSEMSTRDIPVIFMTALSDEADKVKGFAAGAVDYITKPIQEEEVAARVKTHIALADMRQRLQAQNLQLTQEIIERKQIEAALQQANLQLKTTLEDLQRTQEHLIDTEKMVALGQLIAGVAHEINSPLGAIRTAASNMLNSLEQTLADLPAFFQDLSPIQQDYFLQLMQRASASTSAISTREERGYRRLFTEHFMEAQIDNAPALAHTLIMMGIYDQMEEFLPLFRDPKGLRIVEVAYKLSGLRRSAHIITTASDRAAKVAFALKSYARYDHSGEMVREQILDGIETVLTLYHNQLKHGVEICRQYADLPAILCHPDELNQVWTNLIHNALYAMESNGILTITASADDQWIRVSITDTGQGIPTAIHDKIFTPFFTTKPIGEGSGLGLHIVQKIIEKHAGTIQVTSEEGKGATFTVALPIR